MRLVYKDTGMEVKVGDVVPMHDDDERTGVRVKYFAKPHKPNSSGKVTISVLYDDSEEEAGTREYYVGVIGAEWIEREDRV